MACPLAHETVWIEKAKYADAEKNYYEKISKLLTTIKPMEQSGTTTTVPPSVANLQPAPVAVNGGASNASSSGKAKKNRNKGKKDEKKETTPPIAVSAVVTPSTPAPQNPQPQNTQSKDKEASIDNTSTSNDETKTKKKKKKKNNKQGSNASPTPKEAGSAPEKGASVANAPNQQQQAEKQKPQKIKGGSNQSTLVSEIAKAREHIKNSLEKMDGIASLAGASAGSCELLERIVSLEKQNSDLTKLVEKLSKTVLESQNKIKSLEDKFSGLSVAGKSSAPAAAPAAAAAADDDDGVDLFASDDEEDADAAKIREERLAAYAAKKSKKPVLIAKSSVLLDVKPWDDETDMKEMEKNVRTIEMDGLLWGASKLVPVGYGINKLQIMCVIEDEKVSIDLLTEKIEEFEDFVQSVDIAAFNKI